MPFGLPRYFNLSGLYDIVKIAQKHVLVESKLKLIFPSFCMDRDDHITVRLNWQIFYEIHLPSNLARRCQMDAYTMLDDHDKKIIIIIVFKGSICRKSLIYF